MIAFQCPKCQKTLRAPEEKIGARSKCPYCQCPVRVPPGTNPPAAVHALPYDITAPPLPGMTVTTRDGDKLAPVQSVSRAPALVTSSCHALPMPQLAKIHGVASKPWWRPVSPSLLMLALLTFPLPWVKMSCNGGPVGGKTLLSQSGFQAIYGGVDFNSKLYGDREIDEEKDKLKKLRLGFWDKCSPLMVVYPLLLVAAIPFGFKMRPTSLRAALLFAPSALALSLLLLQLAIGFPIERVIDKSIAEAMAKSKDDLDKQIGPMMAMAFDVSCTGWFWLGLSSLLAALGACALEWFAFKSNTEGGLSTWIKEWRVRASPERCGSQAPPAAIPVELSRHREIGSDKPEMIEKQRWSILSRTLRWPQPSKRLAQIVLVLVLVLLPLSALALIAFVVHTSVGGDSRSSDGSNHTATNDIVPTTPQRATVEQSTASNAKTGIETRFGDLGVVVSLAEKDGVQSETPFRNNLFHEGTLLVVNISYINHNESSLVRVSGQCDGSVRLADDKGNSYQHIVLTNEIGVTVRAIGQILPGEKRSVRSDQGATDVVLFEKPLPGAKILDLTLDASRWGSTGSVRFSGIHRTNSIGWPPLFVWENSRSPIVSLEDLLKDLTRKQRESLKKLEEAKLEAKRKEDEQRAEQWRRLNEINSKSKADELIRMREHRIAKTKLEITKVEREIARIKNILETANPKKVNLPNYQERLRKFEQKLQELKQDLEQP